MSEISRFYGIIITMYFPDHNPPHFHVRHNEFRALINISTGEITGSMSRRALELVYKWMDDNMNEEGLENCIKATVMLISMLDA